MGMPLENSYLFHGHKGRNFNESSYWKTHSSILQRAGLDLLFPTAGASEIINQRIVENSSYDDYSESCLRSKESGKVCARCWKCFRKNALLGVPFEYAGEIKNFLQKRPLKQAASTIYSIQKGGVSKEGVVIKDEIEDIKHLLNDNYQWMDNHYPPALNLLPPRYLNYTKSKLEKYARPMSAEDISNLEGVNMFPEKKEMMSNEI